MSILEMFYLLIAAIFIISGIAKLASVKEFQQTIEQVGIPSILSSTLRFLIPLLEFLGALFLLFTVTRIIGLYIILFLLLSFAISTIYVLYQGKQINCNCFGQMLPETFTKATLLRIVLLFGITIYLLLQPSASLFQIVRIVEMLLGLFAAIGLFYLYTLLKIEFLTIKEKLAK